MAERRGGEVSPGRRARYMVAHTDKNSQGGLEQLLRADPEIGLLNVVGPPARPDLYVVEMSSDRAERLRQEFGGQVTVEPDAPLTLS
jgi:hypothetical protein